MVKRIGSWFGGVLILLLVSAVPGGLAAQGLGDLAGRTASDILNYFSGGYNVSTAVVKFESSGTISGPAAQKFYQIMVSRLETAAGISYTDLMINFNHGEGQFNLNRAHGLNHLIYIKLSRHRDKIGAGISIFSRTLNKIVYIRYLHEPYGEGERDIFETRRYGFRGMGFSRIVSLDVGADLLDAVSLLDHGGRLKFIFLYPRKLVVSVLEGNRLRKALTYPIAWPRPHHPVITPEGKLTAFLGEPGQIIMTAGVNFCRYSVVLGFTEDDAGPRVEKKGTLDFVPHRLIRLNKRQYLAGGRWALGKNFFRDQLLLYPFGLEGGRLVRGEYLLKAFPAFYALDFSTPGPDAGGSGPLNSVHVIDRDYRYRFFADNFEPLLEVTDGKRGAALGCLDDRWLAVSDFSTGTDRLYFHAIENGGLRPVYENRVGGEIGFISAGQWKGARGFWVYTTPGPDASGGDSGRPRRELQFWSKKE